MIPHFRAVAQAIQRHGALALQQLYHIGSHGNSDLSFHPHWSPSGMPSYHDSDGSHAMSSPRSRRPSTVSCRRHGAAGRRASTGSRSGPPTTASSTNSGRPGRTGATTAGAGRWRTAPASRAILSRIRQVCGPDFIVGLAISDETDFRHTLSRAELCEIVALHDGLGLIDYVTCGTASYFNFEKQMPTFLFPRSSGWTLRPG